MHLSTIYCGSLAKKKKKKKRVQVIFPTGEFKLFDAPITLKDLLLQYPRHYCVPHVPGSSPAMDDELVGGSIYLLLPLPRLGINPTLRRAKSWEPSLHMIAESSGISVEAKVVPLAQKNIQEHKPVSKIDKKGADVVQTKPTYSLNRKAWDTGRAKSMEYMAPSAFIF